MFHEINGDFKKALNISRVVSLRGSKQNWAGLVLVLWVQGGGEIPPPPLNAENIKTMIKKLKGQLERLKLFPLRSATLADGVT